MGVEKPTVPAKARACAATREQVSGGQETQKGKPLKFRRRTERVKSTRAVRAAGSGASPGIQGGEAVAHSAGTLAAMAGLPIPDAVPQTRRFFIAFASQGVGQRFLEP